MMGDDLTTILAQLSENSPLPSEDGLNGLDTSLDTAPFGSAEDALRYIMGEQHHLGDLSESLRTMTDESDIVSVLQSIEDCNHHRTLVERANAEFQAENLIPWFRLFLEKFLVAKKHTEILGWHYFKVQPRSQTVVHFGPAADRQTLAEIVHRGTSGGKTRSYGYRKDLVERSERSRLYRQFRDAYPFEFLRDPMEGRDHVPELGVDRLGEENCF